MNLLLLFFTVLTLILGIVAMLIYRDRIYSKSSRAIRTAKTSTDKKFQAELAKQALSIPPLRVDFRCRISSEGDGGDSEK